MAKIAVAPLVGAWIEITQAIEVQNSNLVAPLVGAWIEIDYCNDSTDTAESLPSWERGLK